MRLSRLNLKLLLAFVTVLSALVAQDSTSYLTPDVMRVGGKLACRCGGCRNTVGDCPMLRCSSADPMRHRIFNMKSKGMSDGEVVDSIVREEGIVALAAPPGQGVGPLVTWLMPAVVLALGFWVYSWYVRRNRKEPEPVTADDQAMMDRFRGQLDPDLDDFPAPQNSGQAATPPRKSK